MRAVIDDTSFSSNPNALPGISVVVVKPPYKDHGEWFIHVAIESEVVMEHSLRHDDEWPETLYRRKIYEVRIPFDRVTIQK